MKNITVNKFNKFLFFKLPSAYWCGVRLKVLTDEKAIAKVRYKWFNTNPFKSMYFAVQSMAAELSTGALVAKKTMEHKEKFAMLVIDHSGSFTKKATGKILFTCNDGKLVDDAIQKAIETNLPQKITMRSIGIDEKGNQVSSYVFTWSIKQKSN